MKKANFYHKLLYILSFCILPNCNGFAQNCDNNTDLSGKPINLKRHINELAYQFPFMIEYGYYHNFNNIIEPGFVIKLGIGVISDEDYFGDPKLELITSEINLRNAFSRRKDDHFIDYDIGLAFLYGGQFDDGFNGLDNLFYGLNFQSNFRIYKILKIGLDAKLGSVNLAVDEESLMILWYPYVLFSF
jgi:hypothetical protein